MLVSVLLKIIFPMMYQTQENLYYLFIFLGKHSQLLHVNFLLNHSISVPQLLQFPLISRSGLLEKRIGELTSEDGSNGIVKLNDMPGGSKAFELVAKFCYGMKLELTSSNVVSLRCAAEYLEMTEDYGEGNLIAQTEAFLSEVFSNWAESLKALESCEEVLTQAEEAHVVSRCINSLAIKACSDPTLFGWPVSGQSIKNPKEKPLWNGISTGSKSETASDDWWYEDASFLSLPLYKRLIKGVELRGMKPEKVSGSIMFYARKNIPMLTKMPSPSAQNDANPNQGDPNPSENDQKNLLEEIVNLLPTQKGVTQTRFLLRLLKTAMHLHASPACIENIEKRVGAQLEQASLVDLLIPNMGNSGETLYDVDCVQRMVDHFMQMHQGVSGSSSPTAIEDGGQLLNGAQSIASMTMVAELVDSYLAEIAPDINVKPAKFQALAAVIPDYARPRYDGFYHAVDIYLKVVLLFFLPFVILVLMQVDSTLRCYSFMGKLGISFGHRRPVLFCSSYGGNSDSSSFCAYAY